MIHQEERKKVYDQQNNENKKEINQKSMSYISYVCISGTVLAIFIKSPIIAILCITTLIVFKLIAKIYELDYEIRKDGYIKGAMDNQRLQRDKDRKEKVLAIINQHSENKENTH